MGAPFDIAEGGYLSEIFAESQLAQAFELMVRGIDRAKSSQASMPERIGRGRAAASPGAAAGSVAGCAMARSLYLLVRVSLYDLARTCDRPIPASKSVLVG